jgi:hypothetical protein
MSIESAFGKDDGNGFGFSLVEVFMSEVTLG